MNRLLTVFGVVLVAYYLCGSACMAVAATTTCGIVLPVEHYAVVTLDVSSVDVVVPDGPGSVTVNVGGTIQCNCRVNLYARITAPTGALGTWSTTANPVSINTAGTHYYGNLLTITVNVSAGQSGASYTVGVSEQRAASEVQIPVPQPGYATITVVTQ